MIKKPKILTLITRMERGGVPYEVVQVATHPEISKRYENVIATGFCENEIEIPPEIKVRRIKNFVREISPLKDILALIECIRVIREERPDIIHTRTSKAGFIGRLAALLTGSKNVIYSPHGHIFYGYFSPLKTFVFSVMEYIASFFTDVITVRTDDERIAFESIGCRTKFFNIPKAPVKTKKQDKKVQEILPKIQQIKKKNKIIGTISRFEPVKGVEYIAKAFVKLREKRKDVFLLLVGDGSERTKIEDVLKEVPKDEYMLTGWIDSKDKIYPLFDVFVVSSLNEAWGITILEAGEFGIPIVATDVGGIPYFAGGYVKLVPPKNEIKIAEAIEEILDNRKLARLLSQRSKELHSKFTEELMIKRYIELYDMFLKNVSPKNNAS